RRAVHLVGDDRGTGGIVCEIPRRGNTPTFVGDVDVLTVRQNAVRRVSNRNRRALGRRRTVGGNRRQVDTLQGIVLVQQNVGWLVVRRDGNAGRIRGTTGVEVTAQSGYRV